MQVPIPDEFEFSRPPMNPFKAALAAHCSMLEGASGPGAGRQWATEYTQDMVALARQFNDGQDVNTDTVHFSHVDGQVRVMVQSGHIEASKSDYGQTNGVQAPSALQSTMLDEIGWTKTQVRRHPFNCPGRLRVWTYSFSSDQLRPVHH